MEKKNGKAIKVIVIAIVAVILLIIIGILVMLKTDLFKSEKMLFGKYALHLAGVEKNSTEQKLKEYIEKRKNTTYTVEGGISTNIDLKGQSSKYKLTNNSNIRFKGDVDEKNDKMKLNISLNYAEGISFPFEFKKVGDEIGLQTKYIGKKSVVFDNPINETLKENLNTENEEEAKEAKEIIEKVGKLLTELTTNIIQLADKSYFTKVEGDIPGYKFTVTESQLESLMKDALIKIKEEEKDDEKLQKIVAEMLKEFEDESNTNEEIIKNDTEKEESTLEVTIYGKKNKFNKISVKADNTIIELYKEENGEGNSYILKLEILDDKEEKSMGALGLKAQFKGLGGLQNIYETYEINFSSEDIGLMTYTINNAVKFEDGIEIEEFNDKNSVILKDLPEEKREKFLEAVQERLEKVNKKHMKELGIANPADNPILPLIGGPIGILGMQIYNQAANIAKGTSMDDVGIQQFNGQFTKFEGNAVKESSVKELLDLVRQNNEKQDEKKQIKIMGINSIENNRDTEKRYKVRCKTGEQGYINEIEITESNSDGSNKTGNGDKKKEDSDSAEDIQAHNKEMEKYEGTKVSSASVRGLLQRIYSEIKNKNKYQIKEINFNGKENEASLINIELISDKIKESMDKIYQVDFEKDSETGAINRVIITEK